MSHPVCVMRTSERVGHILDVLRKEKHAGFPVVDNYNPEIATRNDVTFGTNMGLITRTQLIVLLKYKVRWLEVYISVNYSCN